MPNNEIIASGNFTIFSNPDFSSGIRTQMINQEPWFVGKDVAEALGYNNSRDAIAKHVDTEDKGIAKCDTLGGTQEMVVINESGVYSLVFSSKLSSAKKFKRWITSEVLPALRKTGSYSINNVDTPIVREEMAMYITNLVAMFRDYTQVMERRDKLRDEKLDKLLDAQVNCYSNLSDCGKAMGELAARVAVTGIATDAGKNTVTAPSSSVNKLKTKKSTTKGAIPSNSVWVKEAQNNVYSLSKKSGIDVRIQSREIYDTMRRNGCKIIFKPGYKTINSIAKSKKLRAGFEKAIEELNEKYHPGNTPRIPQSVLIRKVPDKIKADIMAYAKKHGTSYVHACNEIYKKIESASNVSLDKMQNEYAHRLGFSSCNKAYMISNSNELLNVFNKIIKEA